MSKYSLTASIRLQHDPRSLQQLRNTAEKSLAGLSVSLNTKGLGQFNKQLSQLEKNSNGVARSLSEIHAQTKLMGKGFDTVGQSLTSLGRNGKNGFGLITETSKQTRQAVANLLHGTNGLTNGVKTQTNAVQKLSSGWASLVTQSIAVYAAYAKVNESIKSNIDLMEQSINLAQTRGTKISAPAVQGLVGKSRGLGAKYGTDSTKLLKAYAELEQAGLSQPELMDTLAKLDLNKQNDELENISSLMVTINRSWGIKSKDEVEQYFNTMLDASKRTKASVDSLAEGSSILNNIMFNLGGTYQDIFALLGKGEDITGRSSVEIARALNTILSNIETKGDTKSLLAQYGVTMFKYDAEKGTQVFDDPIKNLKKIKFLIDSIGGPNSEFGAQIVESVAGVRRSPIYSALNNSLDAIEKFRDSLKLNVNDAIEQDANIALDSLQNKFNRLGQTLKNVVGTMMADNGLKNLGGIALDTTSSILKLVEALSKLAPLLLTLGIGKAFGGSLANAPLIGRNGVGGSSSKGSMFKYFSAAPDKTEKLQLLKLNQAEIAAKYKVLESHKVEQYARQQTIKELKSGIRVWQTLNGEVRKVGTAKQWMMNKPSFLGGAGNFVKNNAFGLGAVGLGAMSMVGGDGAVSQGVQAGGQIGMMGAMLGLNPLISAVGGATIGIMKWADAVTASTNAISEKTINESQQRQQDMEQAGGRGSLAYANETIRQYSQLNMDRKKIESGYDELSGLSQFAWSAGSVKKSITEGRQVMPEEYYKTSQAAYVESSRANVTKNINQDVEDIARIFGAKTLEEFKNVPGGQLILAEGQRKNADYENIARGIIDGLSKEAEKLTARPPVVPSARYMDTVRNSYLTNRDASGLNNVGSTAFSDAVSQLPNTFDKAGLESINRIKQILPDILSRGFAREDMVPAVAEGLMNAGIGEGVVNSITTALQQMNLESISNSQEDLAKVTDELTNVGFGNLLEKSIQAKDAMIQFAEELNNQLQRFTEQGIKSAESSSVYYKAQAEIMRTVIQFQNGSILPLAGSANRIAQQQAMDLSGTADANEIGRRIMALQAELENNKNNTFRTSGIQTTIDSLKQALQVLGSTADRTGDIFAALNEQETKTLSRKNFVKGFMSSDLKGRMEMMRGLALTSRVTQENMDLNKLPIHMQQQVISTLESLGTAPFAGSNGVGADKVLDALLSKASGMDFVNGSPEKQALQQQIVDVMTNAADAMRVSAETEKQNMKLLFDGLHAENKMFLDGLSTVIRPVPGMAKGGIRRKHGVDKLPTMLSEGEMVLPKTQAEKYLETAKRRNEKADSVAAALGRNPIERFSEFDKQWNSERAYRMSKGQSRSIEDQKGLRQSMASAFGPSNMPAPEWAKDIAPKSTATAPPTAVTKMPESAKPKSTGTSIVNNAAGMQIDFSPMLQGAAIFKDASSSIMKAAEMMSGMQIQLVGNHKVEVLINGGAALATMQESIKTLVILCRSAFLTRRYSG